MFEDGSANISIWLRTPKTKDAIIYLKEQGDEVATKVYEYIKYDVIYTKEELMNEYLKYIYEHYIIGDKKTTVFGPNDKFETGVKIKSWFQKNKTVIIKMADSNMYAAEIVKAFKLDVSTEEKLKKQTILGIIDRMQYIYDTYIVNGKDLPKHDSGDTFEDGTPIYKWINREVNKKIIKELYLEGNELAREIVKRITWGKKYLISISEVNLLALEICLSKNWVLERDVSNYPTYKVLQARKVKKLVK